MLQFYLTHIGDNIQDISHRHCTKMTEIINLNGSASLFLTGGWLLVALFAAAQIYKGEQRVSGAYTAAALTLLFALENMLLSAGSSYRQLAASGFFPPSLPTDLPAYLNANSIGIFFFGALLLLLGRERRRPALLQSSQEILEERPWARALKRRLSTLRTHDKIQTLFMQIEALCARDLPPETLLTNALELLGRYDRFTTVWAGIRREAGNVEAVYVSDENDPPFLTPAYGVSFVASPAEAANPSEYAFFTGDPHLFTDAKNAPMTEFWHRRLRFSTLASVISVPLFFPGSTRPDGVLTIYTDRACAEDDEILTGLNGLMRRVMTHAERHRHHYMLRSRITELESAKALYESIVSTVPVRIYWKDRDLVYLGANQLFANDAQLSSATEIIGKKDAQLIWTAEAETFETLERTVIEHGKEQINQVEKQGNMWRLSNRAPLKNTRGEIIGIIGTYIDFTLQQRAKEYLEENEYRFRQLLDQVPSIAIQGFDAERRINYWNRQSESLYGYSAKDAQGKRIDELLIPEGERSRFIDGIANWLHHGENLPPQEQTLIGKNSQTIPVYSARILIDRSGSSAQFYAVDIDLSRQKAAEEQLKKLADFDALTMLPNRHSLNKHLNTLIQKATRNSTLFAIFFIDLDNFKYINDTFGHQYGDELLIEAAARLKNVLRDYDFIARFGGDEFIVTIEYDKDAFITSHIAQKMIAALQRPFDIRSRQLFVSASIGITLFPQHGTDLDMLLKQADTAMYNAKNSGKNQFAYYTNELNASIAQQVQMESALRRSFDEDKLVFYYQPQIDLASKKIVSCEALVRWYDEESRQFIPPETFLPIVEKAHLMRTLTQRAILSAVSLLDEWRQMKIAPVRIDINMPAAMLKDDDLLHYLLDKLRRYDIDPSYIGIEITETQLIDLSPDASKQTLQAFSTQGIHISIDDFGTGYSSLSYLSRLTIDTVKIDRSFVLNHENDRNRALIRSIIAMAHALNYQVTAEGVETEEQAELLKHFSCDKAQGNFYHPPLHPEAITERLYHASHDMS